MAGAVCTRPELLNHIISYFTREENERIKLLINIMFPTYSFREIFKFIFTGIKDNLLNYTLHICIAISEMTCLKYKTSSNIFYNIACLTKNIKKNLSLCIDCDYVALAYDMFSGNIPPSCLLILTRYGYECYMLKSKKRCCDLFFEQMEPEIMSRVIDSFTPAERNIYFHMSNFILRQKHKIDMEEYEKMNHLIDICQELMCQGFEDSSERDKIIKPEYLNDFLAMLGKIKNDRRLDKFCEDFQKGTMEKCSFEIGDTLLGIIRETIDCNIIYEKYFLPGLKF
jgi:hypothetical protein